MHNCDSMLYTVPLAQFPPERPLMVGFPPQKEPELGSTLGSFACCIVIMLFLDNVYRTLYCVKHTQHTCIYVPTNVVQSDPVISIRVILIS